MVFLPALTLCCIKLLDKTKHKEIKPKLNNISKFIVKLRIPIIIIVLALIIPAFIFQGKNSFTYGMGALDPNSRAGRDEAKIIETFGRSVPTVVHVPKGDTGRENELCEKFSQLENVTSVVSYTTAVGAEIPPDIIDNETIKIFNSENYSSII